LLFFDVCVPFFCRVLIPFAAIRYTWLNRFVRIGARSFCIRSSAEDFKVDLMGETLNDLKEA
jgi:hypothetical protein